MHIKPIAAFVLALALGSCSSGVKLETGVPAIAMRDCASSGGTLAPRGKKQEAVCVHPYPDAGKSCSSSSQCGGRCIAKVNADGSLPKIGESAAGMCQADDKLFGCFAELKNGKVSASMCID